MAHVIETTVFTFDELSDKAKERARDWWREASQNDEWWDGVYDDAKECAKILGINIDNIYFSGFCSPGGGDGACFEGSYTYTKGASKAIREYAPQDSKLHSIADTLQEIQAAHFYGLEAQVKNTGLYSHEYSTTIDVFDRDGDYADAETAESLADTLRNFMRWIYRRLESEYEWLNSDETVGENIRANECTFTETGERFG